MDTLLQNDPPNIERSTAQTVFLKAQILYPVILLLAFILSAGVHSVLTSRSDEELDVPTVRGPGGKPLPVTKRKREHEEPRVPDFDGQSTALVAFKHLAAAVVLTFFANCLALAVHASSHPPRYDALKNSHWQCSEERMVYLIGSAFFYIYVLITLFDWQPSPNMVHMIVWTLGLIGELTIMLSFAFYVIWGNDAGVDMQQLGHPGHDGTRGWDMFDMVVGIVRLSLFALLVGLYTILTARRSIKERRLLDEESNRSDTDETSPLLNGNGANYHTQTNGRAPNGRARTNSGFGHSNGSADSGYQQPEEEAAFYRPEKLPHKTWFEYCRGYTVFFPYLWPSNSLKLQGIVLMCFVLIILQRIVNVMVPTQINTVTEILPVGDGKWKTEVGLLILYKLLQGQSGLLGSLRSILWIPVSQHTYRALTTASFEHVHSLSLDFHLGKRTGEVLSALNKGASINQFLEQVTFQVIPMLVDLLVAIFWFYNNFGPMYSMFVSIITFYYLYLTIRMAATRADQRRDMVNADREEEAVKNDSITSYETVKYFNAEKYEFNRYRNAILTFQKAEAKVTWGINNMNMCQSLVFMSGIMVTMMYCANEVRLGKRTVGDFVALVTYLGQLQGPLNFFGTFYRTVQQAMISGERLLELFKIQPTVVDQPHVEPLPQCNGHIKWDKVKFSYDKRRRALHDVSFECKPGTTTAFVGESGGGKSTVFRLMFRYYNCESGKIQIDGEDVKDLTIDSVRRFIGVVPQDTMLFNETLMYNLKYANPLATDEDVYEACRAAAIHDRIMSFPDGYLTKVGERGLRLSGGEKQRVAIARTILKNPKIIMLDEATSALDGETEQKIQSKLISGNFGQDRTLLIIAHRLSTITHADQIIVLHAGTIVEKGTHTELLALNGRYASMWDKHCRAEQAAEEARDATRKARKLLCQANLSRGDETPSGYNSMVNSTVLPPRRNIPLSADSATDSSSQRDNASVSGDSTGSENGSEGTLRDDSSDDSHESDGYEPATINQPTLRRENGYMPLGPHHQLPSGPTELLQHPTIHYAPALRQAS
ncbi:heavy metal tolerance protein [Naviculisporaceae sp. PSN 640]